MIPSHLPPWNIPTKVRRHSIASRLLILSHIALHIIVGRVGLLVHLLLRLRSSWAFKIARFRWSSDLSEARHFIVLQSRLDYRAHRPDPPFSPGLEIMSPPSSTGISRLSPAPEAEEPTFTPPPGYFVVALVSTPDSLAVRTC